MKHLKKLALMGIIGISGLALVSCGNGDHSGHMMDHDMADKKMDDGAMQSEMKDGMVPVNGVVKKVFAGAGRVKIKHEPVPAMKMGAMTMSFQTAGDIDLSEFSENDDVEFMLKKGRDGSFRIMSICKKENADTSCMEMMEK